MSVAVLAGATFAVRAELVNGIRAIVHDSIITYDEVSAAAGQAAQYLQRQHRNDPETLRKKLGQLMEDNLEQLVQRQLVLRDFEQAGYNLPESIVDEAVGERLRERFGGDRVKLTKTLQAEGMTYEKYRQQLRDQIIVEILRSKNVSQAVVMSPHKIEEYYRANGEKYKVEDQVRLRMIVLRKDTSAGVEQTRKLAEEVLAKIKQGATFVEMATIHSQGSQRAQGGDWGWVDRSTLFPGLSDIAFALDAGQVSGVVGRAGSGNDYWLYQYTAAGLPDTARHYVMDEVTRKEKLTEERKFPAGTAAAAGLPPPEEFYLVFVEDKKPAHIRPLNEIREEIERTLLIEQRARMQKRYVDKLRNKTFVRYF